MDLQYLPIVDLSAKAVLVSYAVKALIKDRNVNELGGFRSFVLKKGHINIVAGKVAFLRDRTSRESDFINRSRTSKLFDKSDGFLSHLLPYLDHTS